jgi:hypothetical protein
MDAFHQLIRERERTMFVFYGFLWTEDGEVGGNYLKQAYSLGEALADLEANKGVADVGGYWVKDAFIQMENGDPIVHVELSS